MQKADLVVIRDYMTEDLSFIMSTWLRGMYHGDSWFSQVPKNIFMECYHRVLENLLARPETKVKVACLKDDPSVILGYSVFRNIQNVTILDYVFVKFAWRTIGIAKSLIPENLYAVTHLTKAGASIRKSKLPNVPFNPFLI